MRPVSIDQTASPSSPDDTTATGANRILGDGQVRSLRRAGRSGAVRWPDGSELLHADSPKQVYYLLNYQTYRLSKLSSRLFHQQESTQ